MLAHARYLDLVRVVLARGYRICLAGWVYADYLDHEVTVVTMVVGTVSVRLR